ncbi:MAG TPA: sugar transferase [bacterium]|nr:sugar transferase [bacterium]
MISTRKRGVPKGPLYKFVIVDLLVAVASMLAAFRIKFGEYPFPAQNFLFIAYLFPVLFAIRFFVFLKFRLYDFRRRYTPFDVVYLTLGAVAFSRVVESFTVYYVALYWSTGTDLQPSRAILFLWDPALFWLGCCAWRLLYLLRRRRWAYDRTRVLIVGAGDQGESIRHDISEYSALGHEVVGLVDDGIEEKAPGADVLGTLRQLPKLVEEYDVDEIIIATERAGRDDLLRILSQCQIEDVQVWLLPALYEVTIGRVEIGEVAGIPLITANREPLGDWGSFFKRSADLVFALIGLLFLLLVLPLIALLIKLSSPGPVFYRQKRVGKDGRMFTLYKFRTMRQDAEKSSGPVLSWADDPRVTPIGRILRRLHLDELPQLWNVLKGDMSIVGPRPERPEFAEEFSQRFPAYRLRFAVRPGMTGLAQIHGYYDSPVEHKLRYDLAYIGNISGLLDLKILLSTLRATLSGREQVRERNHRDA